MPYVPLPKSNAASTKPRVPALNRLSPPIETLLEAETSGYSEGANVGLSVEVTESYEEKIADVQQFTRAIAQEEERKHAEIQARMELGEITGPQADNEFHGHMDAFFKRNMGDEVRANQALNGALKEFHENRLSAEQLNRLYEAAGAKLSGVEHYQRSQEQLTLGRHVEEKLENFFEMERTPSGKSDPGQSQEGLRDGRRVYNPQTDEWLTLATQEEANGLADAFEASEKADREFLFSDAAKVAQVSWGRYQQLAPLLEDFPTYPGPGPGNTTNGHVIALARVMEGMDAALRYAQQAENEANAPRLFVPFYSFVEKAREGASMEEQQLAFAYGAGLMLDYLSLGTLSLATAPAKVVESVAVREVVAVGEAAVKTAARTGRNFGRRGNAFTRFFYDPRNYERQVGPDYWTHRGPANGRSLHHWLFPRRATGVPEGIRNAGFNLFEMRPFRGVFHRNLDANTWMGFARTWGGSRALKAARLEKSIRIGLPAAGGTAAYSGYKAGEWIKNLFTERK